MQTNELIKTAYIRKLKDGKYRVFSEKGKNLGTYDSLVGAKKRLKQVHYFKYKKASIDLTEIEDLSLSAIMRKLNKEDPKKAIEFLTIFKKHFDNSIKEKLQQPDKVSLQNTILEFAKSNQIKLDKDMVKSASISELGDAKTVANYMAQIIKFFLMRVKKENRLKAIKTIKQKIWTFSDLELANKKMPASAAIGQAISFVKIMLFNHEAKYIRDVITNIVNSL